MENNIKKECEQSLNDLGSFQDNEKKKLLKKYARKLGFTSDVSGDACTGDEVFFAQIMWGGSYKRPKFLGLELKEGKILKESYGAKRQQHTFTIENEEGKFTIKGRNLYQYGTFALPRGKKRVAVLEEKHKRGCAARSCKIAKN